MNGNVYDKNGYLYVVLNYKGKDGKHKTKWIKTGLKSKGNKKKAEAMIPDIIAKNRSLEYIEDQESFVNYINNWLKDKKGSIKLATWETYEMYIRVHIIPYFETLGLNIQDIKPKHVKAFYASLLQEGSNKNNGKTLSGRSVRKIAAVLKMVLNEAVSLEDIPKNPALNVPVPKQAGADEFKGRFLTAEEAQKVLDAFRGHELEILVLVTLYYGLRRSEAVGLRWCAVDFENDTVEINHTVVNVSTIVASDTTKTTSSHRIYPLLPEIKKAFLNIKKQQEKNKKAFGNCYKDTDYIFTWSDGTPFRPDSVSRSFQRVLASHGLQKIRFHDLRHSTASFLHDKGWDIVDVKDWLGHADIETTANIYTHISQQRKKKTADSLKGLFTIHDNCDL